MIRCLVQCCNIADKALIRCRAGSRFDTAYTCGNTCFGHDAEWPDISGAGDMCTTAQFGGETGRYHAHFIAVFFTEQCHRAGGNRFILRHQLGFNRIVGPDGGIYFGFNSGFISG